MPRKKTSWQSWRLKSGTALRCRICQTTASLSVPPAAGIILLGYGLPASNMCAATTYHYASGRSGFWCGRTATVELSNSKTTTTWPLPRTQFRRALKTNLFCWWLRRLVTFCFTALCINVPTYLLTSKNRQFANSIKQLQRSRYPYIGYSCMHWWSTNETVTCGRTR